MTVIKLKRFIYFAVFAVICLALLIMQSSGFATLKIGNASAVLMLPATVLAGFYFKEYAGVCFGFAFGAFTDVYSATLCYNTVALAVIGFVSGLLISRLFNSNLAAVSVLNAAASLVYFFFKWLIEYAFVDPEPWYVMAAYMLPSVIYTFACGIIMYFLLAPFYKRMPVPENSGNYE